MKHWTVCIEEKTKRLVPGYMHGKDCNLKFKTMEECMHECRMQQIIRDFHDYMKDDPAGTEQLFKCLKSIATGYAVGSTMEHVMTKLGLARTTMLTETGLEFLIYIARK